MKKNPKKTAQTKAALKTAFWELYQNTPITKITVQDITRLAGFNRSTFYQYFTDVYSVLIEIEDSILRDWESVFVENVASFTDRKNTESMEKTIETIVAFYERNGNYLSVLLSPEGDSLFVQKIKSIIRIKVFSQLPIDSTNAEASLAFEFASSGMLAFLTEWYRNARHIPPKDAVELIYSLLGNNPLGVMLRNSDIERI